MTYEEFKQLAEHPQHRDVPAIFKLEVLETEELEEKKRSHYPKYKVNTYCPQAFTTTLEEAERLMHQDVLYRKKMKEEDDYPLDTFCLPSFNIFNISSLAPITASIISGSSTFLSDFLSST